MAMSQSSAPTHLVQLPFREEDRTRYSATELKQYFSRIALPQKDLDSPLVTNKALASTAEHGLPFLHALTRHHTCNIPFENLELHYSKHKHISLEVADLYDKFVHKRRGGRCMENNTFFATVLRSLGFEVRNCGGRVSRAMSPYPEVRAKQSMTYDGWNHMLNLVRLDDQWYVVDVGMGSMGPNLPYPLQDGFQATSIAPRRIRLQRRAIAESYGTRSNELWCYDVCHNPSADGTDDKWVPTYCFTETEFLPQDYQMMSWFTSTHPGSFFTRYVTSTKMIMDRDHAKIVGNLTLFEGEIKESVGTDRKVVKTCDTEEMRISALAELFDIALTEEQKNAIAPEMRLG